MVDAKLVMALFADAINKQGKTYGPVFIRLAANGIVRFVAEKVNDVPPETNTINEAVQYVTNNLSKYPRGYTTLIYGVGVALKALEGSTGAGLNMVTKSLMKQIFTTVGLDKLIKHIPGTTEALSSCIKFVEMGNVVEKGMLSCSGDEARAAMKVTGCDYQDICERIKQQGLARATGEIDCGWGATGSTSVEIVTGTPHDFKVTKMNPPNCEVSIFRC